MRQDVSKKCFNAIDEHTPDYYCFVLAKTGLIFCKIPKVFCGAG
jgi:hypothetical protein